MAPTRAGPGLLQAAVFEILHDKCRVTEKFIVTLL